MLAATTTPHDNSGTTTPQDVLDLMLEVKIVDDEETFEATSSAVSTAASSLHAALSAETLRRRLSEDEGMEEPVNSAVRLARVTEERVEIQPASVAAKRSSTISVGAVESTAAAVALTPSVAELVVTNPVKPAVAELVSSTSEKHLEAIGTAFR